MIIHPFIWASHRLCNEHGQLMCNMHKIKANGGINLLYGCTDAAYVVGGVQNDTQLSVSYELSVMSVIHFIIELMRILTDISVCHYISTNNSN